MTAPIHVTDATFKNEVLRSPVLTIADFWAEWCAPCKRIAPVLEQIAAEFPGTIKVTKLDVDTNPLTPGQYGVSGIPTLLVFRNGKLLDSIIGFQPKDRLLSRLQTHLSSA
jgi:thioredoxin 1